jgi:hypothetical protein
MKLLTAIWNSEEAEVSFTQDFEQAHWILKADALKDIIYLLEAEYDSVLADKNPLEKECLGFDMNGRC